MKTYYIYHINGVKIGCTSDLIKRMKDQGFTEWEILEEHTDIHEVSNREIELQKQYGYKVDKSPYWKSVENRFKWTDETRHKLTKQDSINGGKAHKGKPKSARYHTKEHTAAAVQASLINWTCIHCNKSGVGAGNLKRWHGDRCKLKA